MWTLHRIVGSVIALLSSFGVAYLSFTRVLPWSHLFTVFHFGLASTVITWCVGLPTVLIYWIPIFICSLLINSFSIWKVISIIAIAATHILITQSKERAHLLNSWKGLWLDWFIFPFLFPAAAFSDLIAKTNLFFSVLAYFIGANFLGLGCIKLGELTWNTILKRTPVKTEDKKIDPSDETMVFVHKTFIQRWQFQSIEFRALMVTIYALYLLFIQHMLQDWDQVERWQIALTVGMGSTLFAYLAPMAGGFALTAQEVSNVMDRVYNG